MSLKLIEEVSRTGYLDETLEHFGISNEELMTACLGRCDNNAFFRKNMGIDWILERHKDKAVNLEGKVRIIIDYDKNFPKIFVRIIPQK